MRCATLTGLALWLFAGAALAQATDPAEGDAWNWMSNQTPQQVIIVDPINKQMRATVNEDGTANVRPAPLPCYPKGYLSAATTNPTAVKPGPGQVCSAISITNSGSTTAGYLRFYDTAVQPLCSSATGFVWGVQIPVNSTAANVAGIVIPLPEALQFQHGIGFCLTGAITNTDTTAYVTGTNVNFGVR